VTGIVFVIGDFAAGMIVGLLTAVGVRLTVWPEVNMVVGMFLGMVVGMAISMVPGFLLSPLLGMFHTMIPAMIIGMSGGMLFGMRDAMGAGAYSLGEETAFGALFGAIVVLVIKACDRILRGSVIEAGD
jgi:hypothetical protein